MEVVLLIPAVGLKRREDSAPGIGVKLKHHASLHLYYG